MSDRKTERLLNLTLALLATKRYLKKSEILENVFGYEGSQESKERMFERDKDDLRSLGIEIEVGDLDPFFEDEPGYRIPQKSYELIVPELSPQELAILSLAANYWNDSVLAPSAQSGIRKLQSLGIPSSNDLDFRLKNRFENPMQTLEVISEAISRASSITFSYDSKERSLRHVQPYRVIFWNGFWYLMGFDTDRESMRLFKLSRFVSEVTLSKKKNEFKIPTDFDPLTYLPDRDIEITHTAQLAISKGSAVILRNRGKFLTSGEDVDFYEVTYSNEFQFLRELLWYGTNVEVIEPAELRMAIANLVKGVIA